MTKLSHTQRNILASMAENHVQGTISPPYYVPLGVSPLVLAGAGPAMTGLLKRKFVEERNRLFYITDAGLAAIAAWGEPA